MPKSLTIAYFITPHGFGHASRAAAVMAAVIARAPHVRFEIFSTCPKELFSQSLPAPFGYHPIMVDIGIVQTSPLREDLNATCLQLDDWLPLSTATIQDCARQLKNLACKLVVCDISPLGIEAAGKAGIPSMLVENFTWDWIYHRYAPAASCLLPHGDYLRTIYSRVDVHIQTLPLCRPHNGATLVEPISRKFRADGAQTRNMLNIPDNARMILISMGGVRASINYMQSLPKDRNLYFVVPRSANPGPFSEHIISLPTHSDFFHPDLVRAADLLIGKVGYSTIAEAYLAGTPFGYITRPNSPESDPLEQFITTRMSAQAIAADAFDTGEWINRLPRLLSLPRSRPAKQNGADQTADYIINLTK